MTPERRGDIAEILRLVRVDLAARVMPTIDVDAARSELTMIIELLGMVASEIGSSVPADTLDAAVRAAARLAEVDPAMDDALARVEQVTLASPDALTAEARRAIAAIAEADEVRLTGRSRSGHQSYAESGAGAKHESEGEAPAFGAPLLEAYLRARDPGAVDAEVVTLRQLPGGFSKSTYIADVRIRGAVESWILRRDMRFSPLRSTVPEEYPLLRTLFARGFPVAEPLWCEADPSRLGAATLAVRRIAGEGDMLAWSQDPARAAAIGCNAARLIAAIHAIDPATLPPLETDAPGARGATPRAQFDHLRAFWADKRIEPNPLIELVFGWLEARIPAGGGRRLVHGDFGLHNLLVEGTTINALLDWEFAHFGDPQEDLAYGRPFIGRIMPWSDFVDAYVAAGGARPTEAALDYYNVFGTLRNAIGCFGVLHALRHRWSSLDAKFAYVGRSYANALLLDAARLTGIL